MQRIVGLTGTVLLALFFIALAVPLRPYVNFSPDAAADVAHAGYVALIDNRDQEAVRWLTDATRMQPRVGDYWQDLGIAYKHLG
jgi:Flp pilus assembly protein TadD